LITKLEALFFGCCWLLVTGRYLSGGTFYLDIDQQSARNY